jgi:hypothetical protein
MISAEERNRLSNASEGLRTPFFLRLNLPLFLCFNYHKPNKKIFLFHVLPTKHPSARNQKPLSGNQTGFGISGFPVGKKEKFNIWFTHFIFVGS